MSEPVVAQKAPIPVDVEEGKTYFWCSCGQSSKQPFCDGSHSGTDFTPMAWKADSSGKKFFCACKKSDKQPFCDGTHSKI